MILQHHLRKARNLFSSEGPFEVAKSAIRYIPIELNNIIFRMRYGKGTKIMDEDWDNLLILDGCRYDMFADQIGIYGRLESRVSLGSSSEEFLERNFNGQTFYDTVYVNANPYIPKLGFNEGTFHSVVDCLQDWDKELETVRPETVAAAAKDMSNKFQNKRLIVHFMQPHHPFIGELGRNLAGAGLSLDTDKERDAVIWEYLESGEADVSFERIWKAYRENLDIVLSEVESVLDNLGGKTVITADHGNLIGERLAPIPTRPKFGHPYGVHTEELVKVPWFVVDSGQRRKITEDPPIGREGVSDEEINKRLKALGYKQ